MSVCKCYTENEQIALDKLAAFENDIIQLYHENKLNPNKVIEQTQVLINTIENSSDSISYVYNKLYYLHTLRAEIFYVTEQYQKSIDEIIEGSSIHQNQPIFGSHDHIALACNYVKLHKHEIAHKHINKAGKGYYITEYILGNFYETTGATEKAKKIYNDIINRDRSHYHHYKLAQNRLIELHKVSPKLLTELYFPTYNPKFNIIQ
jgi:tetratricopeptide (TPR) repeat protein